MRILLVDDDEGFRTTLRNLLTQRADAIDVDEAGDGEAAVRQVARARPDVVVMDLTMPRMTGVEATRRLKARWPQLPVIVLTVHDDPIYERTARAAGADAFVVKKTAGTTLWPAVVSAAAGGPAAAQPGTTGRTGADGQARAAHDGGGGHPPCRFRYLPDWRVLFRPL